MINSKLIELLSDDDKNMLLDEIKQNGYYTLQDITQYINNNYKNNDYTEIDVDIIILIDLHINYKVFIIEDGVYNREQIIDKFNLHAFGIENPEIFFNNQYIEIIDSDYFLFDPETTNKKPKKLLNTNIYIGKEKWKDFMITLRFMRSMTFISNNKNLIESKNIDISDTINNYKNIK